MTFLALPPSIGSPDVLRAVPVTSCLCGSGRRKAERCYYSDNYCESTPSTNHCDLPSPLVAAFRRPEMNGRQRTADRAVARA